MDEVSESELFLKQNSNEKTFLILHKQLLKTTWYGTMKLICYGYLNLNLIDDQDTLSVIKKCMANVSTCTSGTANHPRPKVSASLKATDWWQILSWEFSHIPDVVAWKHQGIFMLLKVISFKQHQHIKKNGWTFHFNNCSVCYIYFSET